LNSALGFYSADDLRHFVNSAGTRRPKPAYQESERLAKAVGSLPRTRWTLRRPTIDTSELAVD